AWPRGRLLGDHHCAWATFAHDSIQVLQETDRFEIFAAAVNIWYPCIRRSAVIAIQHRGDGIDTKRIDVKAFQPVQGARNQKALHFTPPKIVDVSTPVVMKALSRVEVLVQCGAVKPREAVR